MCKYSDNFFFTSNNILRGVSLSSYIMYPPIHPPFHDFNTKFDRKFAEAEKYSYICSGNQ